MFSEARRTVTNRGGEANKAARGVHLVDLARWIDQRAEAARKECRQLCGAAYVEGGRADRQASRSAPRTIVVLPSRDTSSGSSLPS